MRAESKRAGDAYSKAYWKLDATNAKLAKTNGALANTRKKLAEASGRLGSHAAEMYRQGDIDYLALLLTSDTLDDMLVRLEYVSRIGEQDAEVVGEVKALQADLVTRKAEIVAVKKDQSAEAKELKKKATALDKKLKGVQSEYDKVQPSWMPRFGNRIPAAAVRAATRRTQRYGFPVQGSYILRGHVGGSALRRAYPQGNRHHGQERNALCRGHGRIGRTSTTRSGARRLADRYQRLGVLLRAPVVVRAHLWFRPGR